MALMFNRRVRVLISIPQGKSKFFGGFEQVQTQVVEITDMRVQFKVEKNLTKHPNTCELVITNLSPERRAQLQVKGATLILQAGYGETVSQVFRGDIRTVNHVRENAEWNTQIKCGDGERAYQNARVSESFAPKTKVADVIEHIAQAMELPLGNVHTQTKLMNAQYLHGYTAHGLASRELDRVLKGQGYTMSVQDGQILIFKRGSKETTVQIPELSAATGLVGSPEFGTPEKKGKPATIKVKCLLNPLIQPSALVALNSETHKGNIRVQKVTHTGDTAGGDWYTELEAVEINK